MKQACAMILTVLLLLAVFGTGEATNLTTDQILNASFDSTFSLTGAFTAGLNDTLTLYVVADNNYAEVSRADN